MNISIKAIRSSIDRDWLLDLKHDVDTAINEVDAELKHARAVYRDGGAQADPEWYRRATNALGLYKRASQAIQTRLGMLSRDAKRGRHRDACFVIVARRLLTAEVFENIMAEAEAMVAANTYNSM